MRGDPHGQTSARIEPMISIRRPAITAHVIATHNQSRFFFLSSCHQHCQRPVHSMSHNFSWVRSTVLLQVGMSSNVLFYLSLSVWLANAPKFLFGRGVWNLCSHPLIARHSAGRSGTSRFRNHLWTEHYVECTRRTLYIPITALGQTPRAICMPFGCIWVGREYVCVIGEPFPPTVHLRASGIMFSSFTSSTCIAFPVQGPYQSLTTWWYSTLSAIRASTVPTLHTHLLL